MVETRSKTNKHQRILSVSQISSSPIKQCINCKATETAQWRRNNIGSLCNKCGVKDLRKRIPKRGINRSKSFIRTRKSDTSSVIESLIVPQPQPQPQTPQKTTDENKPMIQRRRPRKQKNPRRALFE
jgi:hypothetical protein